MTVDCSYPKACRLRKRAEYLQIGSQATGKMFFGGFMALVRPNNGSITRFGVTVTRKIGSAVIRNRLKRQAREFFRLGRSRWPNGLDILFIATKQAKDLWPPEPRQVARLEKFFQKNASLLSQTVKVAPPLEEVRPLNAL
jgi:ribonuclease P protein component